MAEGLMGTRRIIHATTLDTMVRFALKVARARWGLLRAIWICRSKQEGRKAVKRRRHPLFVIRAFIINIVFPSGTAYYCSCA